MQERKGQRHRELHKDARKRRMKEKMHKPLSQWETKRVLRRQIKWLREDVQSLRKLQDYNEALNDIIAQLVTENGNLRQRLSEFEPHKGFICVGVEEVSI